MQYVQIHFHFKGADSIGVRSLRGFHKAQRESHDSFAELGEHFGSLASQSAFSMSFSVSLVACLLSTSSTIFLKSKEVSTCVVDFVSVFEQA